MNAQNDDSNLNTIESDTVKTSTQELADNATNETRGECYHGQHCPFTAEAIGDALRIFIRSGSANGREEMRGRCLKLINSQKFAQFIKDNV